MPRSAKSPAARANDVLVAAQGIYALVNRAETISAAKGYNSPEAQAAWECVEIHGATIHRQARILAGKSRGG